MFFLLFFVIGGFNECVECTTSDECAGGSSGDRRVVDFDSSRRLLCRDDVADVIAQLAYSIAYLSVGETFNEELVEVRLVYDEAANAGFSTVVDGGDDSLDVASLGTDDVLEQGGIVRLWHVGVCVWAFAVAVDPGEFFA